VKKQATRLLLILMTVVLSTTACRGGKSSSATATAPTTQTIAPAAGQPTVNGGDAVTQTVDVEDGRSEAEGGVLTDSTAVKTATAAKRPATKPPAKKHK
jgi:hypothetical protein